MSWYGSHLYHFFNIIILVSHLPPAVRFAIWKERNIALLFLSELFEVSILAVVKA